jgi:hypothetical protein
MDDSGIKKKKSVIFKDEPEILHTPPKTARVKKDSDQGRGCGFWDFLRGIFGFRNWREIG